MEEDCSYICASCGEEIMIPIDPTQGDEQEFIEDCPVCCCPMVIRVERISDDEFRCEATRE